MTPVANRIIVEMLPEEKEILRALVDSDVRTPRDTFRWLLVEEGRRRGWLADPKRSKTQKHNEEWRRLQEELEDLRDANAALLAQIAYLTGEDQLAAMEDIEAFITDEITDA